MSATFQLSNSTSSSILSFFTESRLFKEVNRVFSSILNCFCVVISMRQVSGVGKCVTHLETMFGQLLGSVSSPHCSGHWADISQGDGELFSMSNVNSCLHWLDKIMLYPAFNSYLIFKTRFGLWVIREFQNCFNFENRIRMACWRATLVFELVEKFNLKH